SLFVTDSEIQTIPWSSILEKVVQVQRRQQLCVVKDLSIHDVIMRLMRKENYLIGMLNKGALAFPISQWVPIAGTIAHVGHDGFQQLFVLPKTLEWILNWCILQSMFDRNFRIRRDFISDPITLKKRLVIVGVVLLLFSPFLVIFMLVFLFLRHAEQFYNHPSTASSRRWSNLAKWMFREFNEVDHLFKHRVNSSVIHASNYLKQFPAPIITIVSKFISFVSGGFAAVLIIIAFLEESLLEGHIFGRNLFWYAAVFGAITAISRAAVVNELLVLDPQGAMSQVVQHTHFMPKRWRGKENTEAVRKEFETLFQYTGTMLLEEMASIFVTPYLLIFVVPERVESILQFITDFTVDVEGVGDVCSFSLLDFRNHGNRKYGSPFDSHRSRRSSQGKMEKSFLSFQIAYPSWEPTADGKRFLTALKMFRDQKLTSHASFHQNRFLESPFESLWLINGEEQRNFPYILDWFYTSQNHNSSAAAAADDDDDDLRRGRTVGGSRLSEIDEEQIPAADDGPWVPPPVFSDRVRSHLEASTSAPLFHRSVLHHEEEPPLPPSPSDDWRKKQQWWARSRIEPDEQRNQQQQNASFLDPPDFYYN
ncbi:hypothetical protein M569_12811, partial [Genlisea aurea]